MRSSNQGDRHPGRQPRPPRTDLRLSLVRNPTLLPWRSPAAAADAELAASEIVHAASAASVEAGAFLIGGGDVMRRADLAELLGELVRLRPAGLGVCSSGHGLSLALAERLRAAG